MDNISIQIDHLTKVYHLYQKPKDRLKETFSLTRKNYHDDFYALKDISFNIKEGECYGIIGKNGSGKSTLLKIITGVLTETSGDVNIQGRISALLELGAGFNQEYTGIENIYLNGDLMGYTKEEMDERIPEILEFADIGDHVYQPVKTYSSGMFVRLAFAVAINVDPEILIVDEALSVGDAFFQLKCYKKFDDFKKRGKTIVFVTHDLSSVLKYCDRVMVLNAGEKVDEGEPGAMVDLYKQLLVDLAPVSNNDGESIATEIRSNVTLSNDILEYGTKEAQIIGVELYNEKGKATNQIEKFEKLNIHVKVRFNVEIHNPIFTMTIKDRKGTEMTGTNSMFENVDGFVAKSGDMYEAIFSQSFPLQSGSYFLSVSCTGIDVTGAFSVYHRCYDLIEIDVLSQKDTVGFFDTNTQIEIIKQ